MEGGVGVGNCSIGRGGRFCTLFVFLPEKSVQTTMTKTITMHCTGGTRLPRPSETEKTGLTCFLTNGMNNMIAHTTRQRNSMGTKRRRRNCGRTLTQ